MCTSGNEYFIFLIIVFIILIFVCVNNYTKTKSLSPQTAYLIGFCLTFFGVLCVVWGLKKFTDTKNTESYSPYRGTGGCGYKTGYNYLDVYDQQDYYTKYPYIYPTPLSYTTAWYGGDTGRWAI